jgi:hypothetical protein
MTEKVDKNGEDENAEGAEDEDAEQINELLFSHMQPTLFTAMLPWTVVNMIWNTSRKFFISLLSNAMTIPNRYSKCIKFLLEDRDIYVCK